MAWTDPAMPTLNQLVQDGSGGGGFDWRTQVFQNLKTLQRVLARDVIVADVVSTTTETTVFTTSVAGGTLSTNHHLRLILIGDYLNNSGATRDLFLRCTFGGTTISGGNALSQTAGASRRGVIYEVILSAGNATNVQRVAARLSITTGAAGTVPNLEAASPFVSHSMAVAIDTTTAQTLALTVQHSASDANLSFRAQAVFLELMPS